MAILIGCTITSRKPVIEAPLINVPESLLKKPLPLIKTATNNKDYTDANDVLNIMKTVNINYSNANKNAKQLEALIKIVKEYNETQTTYNNSIKAH